MIPDPGNPLVLYAKDGRCWRRIASGELKQIKPRLDRRGRSIVYYRDKGRSWHQSYLMGYYRTFVAPVPPYHCVVSKNGDSFDARPDNLVLRSRRDIWTPEMRAKQAERTRKLSVEDDELAYQRIQAILSQLED